MIHHGDCVTVMAGMEPASIDAVVTDPPYDLTNRTPDVKACESCGRVLGGRDGKPDACPRCGGTLSNQRSVQGRGFMGKAWDGTGVAFRVETWAEAFRVLKPGGYLLAFGGTRTVHRLASAIEDAGFEIRDTLVWAYAQGFPKGMRPVPKMWDTVLACQSSASAPLAVQTSKPIRVHFGEEKGSIVLALARILPEGEPALLTLIGRADDSSVVPTATLVSPFEASRVATVLNTTSSWSEASGVGYDEVSTSTTSITSRTITDSKTSSFLTGLLTTGPTPTEPSSVTLANGWSWPVVAVMSSSSDGNPSTSAIPVLTTLGPATWNPCVKWAGYNVSLKPAWEPIVMARKPLRGTVAANVTEYGTGALNIDASRIGTTEAERDWMRATARPNQETSGWGSNQGTSMRAPAGFEPPTAGRWPANLILTGDDEGRAIFDGGVEGVVGGGQVKAGVAGQRTGQNGYDGGWNGYDGEWGGYGDSGTYSRFFLIAKSSRGDREPTISAEVYCNCKTVKPDGWQRPDLSQLAQTASTSRAKATSVDSTKGDSDSSMTLFGSSTTTDPSPQDDRSITSMATSRTTESKTSSPLIPSPTSVSTLAASSSESNGGNAVQSAPTTDPSPTNGGTSPRKAGRSTAAVDPATSPESSTTSVCADCGKPRSSAAVGGADGVTRAARRNSHPT